MVGGRLMVRLVSTNLLLLLLHLHLLLHLVQGADISLDAICGNKLVRIRPPPLSLSLNQRSTNRWILVQRRSP